MKELVWKPVKAYRLENLSEDAKSRIAQNIKRNYDTWRTNRLGYEEVWKEIDRHVNQYDPVYSPQADAEKGFASQFLGGFSSKLKMTNVYSHREGLVSSLIKYLLVNDYDFFDVDVADAKDAEHARAVKEYFIWLLGVIDLERSLFPFARDLVQYGTAFASYEWHKETATRWKKEYVDDPLTGTTTAIDYESQDVLYDAPKFTPLNIYYTVIDPTATDIKTATLIMKLAKTPHEISADPTLSKNATWEEITAAPAFSSNTDTTAEVEREQARGNTSFNMDSAYGDKKMLYEAWGDFTDGETIYKNYVAVVMGEKLIRFEPNPYDLPHKPFIVARYSLETNRVYGPSPLAAITGIQAGFDTIINQYVDHWTLDNERPIIVEQNNLVTQSRDGKQKLPPISKHAVWTVRNAGGIKRLDWGTSAGQMNPTAILEFLQQQMERATGDSVFNSGGTPGQYTKTGVAVTAADAGSTKLNMYAKNVEKEAIIAILDMTLDLVRQMGAQAKTFKSEDGTSDLAFNSDLLLADVKFVMRGATFNMTRQMQTTNLLQFLQNCFSSPILSQFMNPIRAIIIAGEALNIRNVRELISPQAKTLLDQMAPQSQSLGDRLKNALGFGNISNSLPKQEPTDELGQQAVGLAASFGGSNPGSGQQAAFNITQQ